MAQDTIKGAGPEIEEHLKHLRSNVAALEGHIEGLVEEASAEGKELFSQALSHLKTFAIQAEGAIKNHLPTE